MMITVFVILGAGGIDSVLRVTFKSYLPNNGYDVSWIEGKLMALGYDYEDALVLTNIDAKYFNIEECPLVVLE